MEFQVFDQLDYENNHALKIKNRLRGKSMTPLVTFLIRAAIAFPVLLLSTIVMAQNPAVKEEIVLGMSTALSGPAADLGKNMKQGVLVGLKRANRAGGVNGRTLRLIALDDGYEPTRTAPNMRRLIQQEHVLVVIGNVGTPTTGCPMRAILRMAMFLI